MNGRYLLGPGEIPFHPPPGGWHPQAVAFLTGMAVADWIDCALAVLFAWGYFRGRFWAAWLGTVALTVSVYAAFVFTWATVASGAGGLGAPYAWVNLPFAPVLVLFALWCHWGATHRLGELAGG